MQVVELTFLRTYEPHFIQFLLNGMSEKELNVGPKCIKFIEDRTISRAALKISDVLRLVYGCLLEIKDLLLKKSVFLAVLFLKIKKMKSSILYLLKETSLLLKVTRKRVKFLKFLKINLNLLIFLKL